MPSSARMVERLPGLGEAGPEPALGLAPVNLRSISTDSRMAARWSGRRCMAPCTHAVAHELPARVEHGPRHAARRPRTRCALIDVVARIFRLPRASKKRQKPTRIPYSCQAQLGTSGTVATPWGAVRYWRAIAFSMSHSSTLTMVQTAMRAPFGSVQRGRSDDGGVVEALAGQSHGVSLHRAAVDSTIPAVARPPRHRHPRALLPRGASSG